VEFTEVNAPPFTCLIDLNRLKLGMRDLIRAFGGQPGGDHERETTEEERAVDDE
jgi:hypothetical protein